VRDKKMRKKLATHDVQDILELVLLADKCAGAVEGCDWLSQPAPNTGKVGKPDVDTAAQGNGKDKPLGGAPTAAVAAASGDCGPRGDKRPRQLPGSDDNGQWCLVHSSKCHNVEECREIKKLEEQVLEQQKQQQRQDGAPP
jgi:hypothetical protein